MMENLGSYSSITTTECENILNVIQKELELRKKSHEHISKIQEEIIELTAQRNILSKKKKFNEKCCILCCSSSSLFRRKVQCHDCHFWVCRSCASWEDQYKTWICEVCEKQRHLDTESWMWFYSRLRLKFNHFGSAKVLESLCQRKKTSDGENDSGYGPSCDYKPLLSLFSSNSKHMNTMADSASHGDCEDEDEEEDIGEEEEEAEIHDSIETIVGGLLGSTLDNASVDRVYINSHYENIFSTYHSLLISAIQNLENSLRRALHNLPHVNGMSPTVALVALKRLITAVIKECESLPYLQSPKNEIEFETNSMSLVDVDIFSSYEGLVASAIINKIVEDNQAKYMVHEENIVSNAHDSANEEIMPLKVESVKSSVEKNDRNSIENEVNVTQGFTEEQLPLECIQIEEVEEITHEYTDSDDDRYSNISHQSSGLQSIDELGMQRGGSEMDIPYATEPQNDGKIPFPEFGPDLVDDVNKTEDSIICHPMSVASWEENWLFRKKRRLPLYSNLKYQLLTYCDEPPCMLIPFPSESSDTLEVDESSSELSESHSVGSLEFSSDNDTEKLDVNQQHGQSFVSNQQLIETSRVFSILSESSDKPKNVTEAENANACWSNCVKASVTDMQDCENAEVYCSNNNFKKNMTATEENFQDDCLFTPKNENHIFTHLNPQKLSNAEITSHDNETADAGIKIQRRMDYRTVDGIFQLPTQPGTIAEREHKKWLNAIPLENNPYSAENISRRNSTPNKPVILGHVSSFEEFEQKFKDTSHLRIKEPLQTKLNCGLKSIDGNLYKRDYYVNHFDFNFQEKDCNFMSLPNFDSCDNESCEGIPEEALNSLEEKVYVSAGKVFTLENHVKRLERELKDMCLSSPEKQSLPPSLNCFTEKDGNNEETRKYICSSNLHDKPNLPSVRILATKFNPSIPDNQVTFPFQNSTPVQQKCIEVEKIKKARPCMKVHSLTARSLSREFRDRAKQNIPKPMNRLLSIPTPANDETTSEHESLCSPASAPSPVNIHQQELVHGYTSDESSTSTSSLPRHKARKHISRTILQRASYWERRAEQGLLSDASVSEEFPGLQANPD